MQPEGGFDMCWFGAVSMQTLQIRERRPRVRRGVRYENRAAWTRIAWKTTVWLSMRERTHSAFENQQEQFHNESWIKLLTDREIRLLLFITQGKEDSYRVKKAIKAEHLTHNQGRLFTKWGLNENLPLHKAFPSLVWQGKKAEIGGVGELRGGASTSVARIPVHSQTPWTLQRQGSRERHTRGSLASWEHNSASSERREGGLNIITGHDAQGPWQGISKRTCKFYCLFKGLSGCFCHSLNIICLSWLSFRDLFSALSSCNLLSSNSVYAAFILFSGCLSTFSSCAMLSTLIASLTELALAPSISTLQ